MIQGNIWLYGLYGGLAAVLFEKTGRFLAFRFALRRRQDRITSLAYGIGHGGIERLMAMALHMTRSALVFASVRTRWRRLYPTAILAHEGVDFAAVAANSYLPVAATGIGICLRQLPLTNGGSILGSSRSPYFCGRRNALLCTSCLR